MLAVPCCAQAYQNEARRQKHPPGICSLAKYHGLQENRSGCGLVGWRGLPSSAHSQSFADGRRRIISEGLRQPHSEKKPRVLAAGARPVHSLQSILEQILRKTDIFAYFGREYATESVSCRLQNLTREFHTKTCPSELCY